MHSDFAPVVGKQAGASGLSHVCQLSLCRRQRVHQHWRFSSDCAPARALLVAHAHRAAAPVAERSRCRRAAPLGDETSASEDAHQEHSHSTAALLGPIGWVC